LSLISHMLLLVFSATATTNLVGRSLQQRAASFRCSRECSPKLHQHKQLPWYRLLSATTGIVSIRVNTLVFSTDGKQANHSSACSLCIIGLN